MKRVKHIAIAASAAALASMSMSGVALAGIADTKHNLSSSGNATFNGTSMTTEICVFCHTPHGSYTGEAAPLWNREMPTATFTTYDDLGSATLDGSITKVGSVSLACLSCHDGQTAMDSLLNFPGSGTQANGSVNWTFEDGNYNGADETLGTNMNTQGVLTGTGIALIGTDLRNDHPVGILYAGGGVLTGTFNDPDFKPVSTKVVGTTTYWYVDVDTDGKRERTDMILYTRPGWTGADEPFVECASCHDPHVDRATADEVMFLRMSNQGSELCLACHIK